MSVTRSTKRVADVPRWVLVPAMLTPLGMIGGWTLAAARQGARFDPVRETISALAAHAATAPGIMTAGLAITGAGHLATALALRPAALPGRLLQATGGVATLLVAAYPVDGDARAHGLAATVAFVSLSLWPAAASRRGATGVLGRRTGGLATAALLALLAWFGAQEYALAPDGGAVTGLAERVLAGAQALWPLVVVLALLGRAASRNPVPPVSR
ncbi:DUF998 domain-containing protein [Pengzhenrongella sp.]|uniref:DUF998 domain-containing protein n=1 Tax=Pengzhenrongella sp. TaxID=2888820 RepID=UPI002F93A03F